MRYLRWYRGIASLEIRNEVGVTEIEPAGRILEIRTSGKGGGDTVRGRRVVVATGQDGGGALGGAGFDRRRAAATGIYPFKRSLLFRAPRR